jgi:hypothetical protein
MPSPRVTVCPATAEEWPVVEQLAQLERHDLSQFRGYVPRADGTYAFDNAYDRGDDPVNVDRIAATVGRSRRHP